MDKTFFTKAVILKRETFRERDSRVAVYTDRSGFLELIARGTQSIKSKLAGHIEPFNQADIMVIKGKKWDYLGAAVNRNVYKNIKNELDKTIYTGDLFRSLTQLIKPGISDEYIYNLIIEYLESINNCNEQNNFEYISRIALLKFISHLGYQPVLAQCVICNNKVKDSIIFSPEKGGVICSSCQITSYSFAVSKETLEYLENNIKKNINELINIKINKKTETECIKLINTFYKYHF
jgi:DNA repair protein RecO (recombination protein O)